MEGRGDVLGGMKQKARTHAAGAVDPHWRQPKPVEQRQRRITPKGDVEAAARIAFCLTHLAQQTTTNKPLYPSFCVRQCNKCCVAGTIGIGHLLQRDGIVRTGAHHRDYIRDFPAPALRNLLNKGTDTRAPTRRQAG